MKKKNNWAKEYFLATEQSLWTTLGISRKIFYFVAKYRKRIILLWPYRKAVGRIQNLELINDGLWRMGP